MTLRENEWFIKVPWGRICTSVNEAFSYGASDVTNTTFTNTNIKPTIRRIRIRISHHVVAWGNCLDPPVLVCHGGSDSIAIFRPLLKLLPHNFYYVGMEFPGNGKSDPFPPGMMLNVFDLVYTVDAVVQHFRWKSFAFIGHSMGAYIGKIYNISAPDKISKLVEIDPINVVGVPPENFSQWYKLLFAEFYDNMDKYNITNERSKTTWSKAIENIKKRRKLPEDVAAATLERWSKPVGNGYIKYTLDPRYQLVSTPPLSPEHIKKLFISINTPTLIIAAKDSYEKGLFRNTIFLLDENEYPNRNVRCRIVEGSHDVHAINPERVATFVGPFLLGGLKGVDSKAKL